MSHSRKNHRKNTKVQQSGQAYAETIVGFGVIALFLLGAQFMWQHAEARQQIIDATRFAAWERVVWEPSDNDTEKFAVHESNDQLSEAVVLHQLSTPEAWRKYREGMQSDGTAHSTPAKDKRDLLKNAMKAFISPGQDPSSLIQTTTESGWTNGVEDKFRGMDPTFGKVTSLELDRDTYRTVKTVFHSNVNATFVDRLFSYVMSPLNTTTKLSLITNTWAGSPPVMMVRTERELLPLSTGDKASGTKANFLANFGLGGTAGQLVGMAPWWNFVGGPNGFAGQYVVKKIGMGAADANGLIQSAGSDWTSDWSLDDVNRMDNLLLKQQVHQPEYFNPNAVSSWHHRHTLVIDESSQTKGEQASGVAPRNSNIGKRKYRALSLQNPVEQYYTAP